MDNAKVVTMDLLYREDFVFNYQHLLLQTLMLIRIVLDLRQIEDVLDASMDLLL